MNHLLNNFARLHAPMAKTALTVLTLLSIFPLDAYAHGVTVGDKGYIQEISGAHVIPFIYLGAKHMVTGYDHVLFLFGVIFYLYKLKDVSLYVSLFAVGHSLTLMAGVFLGVNVSPYLIDAIIGVSVIYKALDNLDAFHIWFGIQPNAKAATLVFGLFHGLGLAAKIRDFNISQDGLFSNLVSFNVGVEIGQILALGFILVVMGYLRSSRNFKSYSYAINVVLASAGFLLVEYQVAGWILS